MDLVCCMAKNADFLNCSPIYMYPRIFDFDGAFGQCYVCSLPCKTDMSVNYRKNSILLQQTVYDHPAPKESSLNRARAV